MKNGEGHECIECELWSEEEWKQKLKEKIPTPEAWMKMTVVEKNTFKSYGSRGLYALATIFGIKENPIGTNKVMAELGRKIYGAHEVFTTYVK